MQTVLSWLMHYGYPALFSLLMLGIVGLPVPDEALLTFCGYLIYSGRLHSGLTFLTGFCGSICGISLSYFIRARFGRRVVLRFGNYVQLTPARMDRVEQLFVRFGPVLLTVGYFIPGVRHFTAIVAGMSGLRWPKFALFAYAGAVLWVCTFLSLGYLVGERWQHMSELVHRCLLAATAIVALAALVVWLVRRQRIDYNKT